ncbi:hypothetical protein Pst134EB_004116 [Puccinia striiformis f. sp. tritici]|nr:hypothetical protein Pst134EB_004116 [Puccinia striiformis f. sp. tritici]
MPSKTNRSRLSTEASEGCKIPQVPQGSNRRIQPYRSARSYPSRFSTEASERGTIPQVPPRSNRPNQPSHPAQHHRPSHNKNNKQYQSPPKYQSTTEKDIAKAKRRAARDTDVEQVYILKLSRSSTQISSKPRVTLPVHGPKPQNLITSQDNIPDLILETHPFQEAPTPTFATLAEILCDLYKMALHRPNQKSNTNTLNGSMRAIGFRQGSDRGKSGGTYARKQGIKDEDSIADSILWTKLQGHNQFIASRIRSLSKTAWQGNHDLIVEHGIPSWDQMSWRKFEHEHDFAGNVIVTFDDFYNKVHQDEGDLNSWTYGIFSYIDRATGLPIPPPSDQLGHGLYFTRHSAIIDFAHANGIVEVLWQTKPFEHCTTPPPLSLRSTKAYTHIGTSFQINTKLADVSDKLKDATDEHVNDRTLCKDDKYHL